MASGSRNTLFGMTLTELVIVLFFIMLLLALNNINDLNDRIPDAQDDLVSSKEIIEILIPEGPISSELIPIDIIKKEIEDLKISKEELEVFKKESEGTGEGDCKEGGFWITSKCADNCWAINNPGRTRQYDYLVDIGVCRASVVVQKSEWIIKDDNDFSQVDGALELTNKNIMNTSELYRYLETIKNPGFQMEPKQCFHSVRLIDLGAGSIPRWDSIDKEVGNRVGRLKLTSADPGYENLKSRFPEGICDTPINETFTKKDSEVQEKIGLSTSVINEMVEANNMTIDWAALDTLNFERNLHRECEKSNNINNSELIIEFDIDISEEGKVLSVGLAEGTPDLNMRDKRFVSFVVEIMKKSLFVDVKNKKPMQRSSLTKKLKFPKDFCG